MQWRKSIYADDKPQDWWPADYGHYGPLEWPGIARVRIELQTVVEVVFSDFKNCTSQ
jgi:hypothetical protein